MFLMHIWSLQTASRRNNTKEL